MNEQTIDAIIKAPARETWQYGVKTAWYTLEQVNAALAAKDARIALAEGCLTRAGWEYIPDAIYGPVWKPPVNKVMGELRAELAAKDAEIERLNHAYHQQRDGAQARVDAAVLRALAAEREIEQLKADAERYRWLRVQHWSTGPLCVVKSPKNAVKLGYYCPSRQQLDSAIDAEISVPAKPAEPEPGEWVDWKGGECPIADGVTFQFRFRDDSQNKDSEWTNATDWNWADRGYAGDIVAYRVLP